MRKTTPPSLSWHDFCVLLANLEFLAGSCEQSGQTNAAEGIRSLLMAYLKPGMLVRYFYAGEWRIGSLLLLIQERTHWQIQRADAVLVDRVLADQDCIRVYVEGTNAPAASKKAH